jgi:hypothetical protein
MPHSRYHVAHAVQLYERILKDQGFPYFVNGAGGQSLNSFKTTPEPGGYAGLKVSMKI